VASANRDWAKQSPYDRFFDFISPGADRYKILVERINSLRLNSTVVNVAGNRHILIFPPGQKSVRDAGAFPFKGGSPFMLVAHYDRVAGSPGANDNSIAVFHLLSAAAALARKVPPCRWIIVFTDKEELIKGEGFANLGSFTLAEKMKSWGLHKAKIFNFDACGSGGTLVLSTTANLLLKNVERANISALKKNAAALRDHALETAGRLRMKKVILAPAPFCDDIGFLRAGLAAQTATMLPDAEAGQYEALLRERPDFADLLISGEISNSPARRLLPGTWRGLNRPTDGPSLLTPEHFDMVVRFAVELCRN
jgi:hypothetical protein